MNFHILTIFPKLFDSYLKESLIKRAITKKIIQVSTYDLRDYTENRHKKVDDKPFSGGPGMVLQVGPIHKAIQSIKKRTKGKTRIVLFSTRGSVLDAKTAKRLSRYKNIIFICGRYEGVDERVAEHLADEEISLGPYILNGGELPAMVTIEAISRFLPGFLGKKASLEEYHGSHPVYTRPEIFSPTKKKSHTWKVPDVLLSGNHQEIEKWKKQWHRSGSTS